MSYIPDIQVESPFEGPFNSNISIQYAPSLRSQDVSYPLPRSNQMTANDGASNAGFYGHSSYWRPISSPNYSPSNGQFNDSSSPLSESSVQEFTNRHYDNQQEQSLVSHSHALNSPAMSNSPFDSLPTTPKSEEHVTGHFSKNYSYPDRPNICVDTALLMQPSHCDSATISSTSQEASPGFLSPHSFTHETKPQIHRRHSHSRSVDDRKEFGLGDVSPSARLSRGHQRNKSAPTSRHNSPYGLEIGKHVSNIRSKDGRQPCGALYPNGDLSPISPSDSIAKQVATERIRNASTNRRKYQPTCYCEECGDTFTTNFARDRHMKSHSGERNFVCSIGGCGQKFTTDSGRKRHEKSKTLHTGMH